MAQSERTSIALLTLETKHKPLRNQQEYNIRTVLVGAEREGLYKS